MVLRLANPASPSAYHDPLTGLSNRAALDLALRAAIADARVNGTGVALAYADLNEFKRVNDSLGHDTGDELLCQVAERLRAAVRPGDLVTRQGGDEFLVLVRDVPRDGRAHADAVGQRIADALQAPFTLGAAELLVDASVGLSLFPLDATGPDQLRKHADAAMYAAKAAGGGVHVYGDGTADPLERLALAARLRRGIERGELELHHQPVMRLDDGCVIGVESLVRWRDGDRGLVPPGDFIPVAERTGVIEALGDWVLHEGLRAGAGLGEAGMQPNVGFNVSPRQLRRPGIAKRFTEIVGAHGIAPGRFVLELTESAWTLERSRLLPVMARAARGGLRARDRRLRGRLLVAVAAARAARADHQGRPRVPGGRAGGSAGDRGLPRDPSRSPTPAAATSSRRASSGPSRRRSWPRAAAGSPRASTTRARRPGPS